MECLNVLVQDVLSRKDSKHCISKIGYTAFLERGIEVKYVQKNNIER